MRTVLAAAALTICLGASGTNAADVPLIIDDRALEMASPSYWDGFYAGIGAAAAYNIDFAETFGFLDAIVGVNVQADSFVFGAEAWLSGWRSNLAGPGVTGGAEVRAGYLVTPEVLAYLSLGAVQFLQAGGGTYAQLGAGVEFGVTESMSLDFEYKYWKEISGAAVYQTHSVSTSALWHF